MTGAFVLDASMAMALHFRDEATEVTLALEDRADAEQIVVPGHWHAEIANWLLGDERKGRTGLPETMRFVEPIGDLDLIVHEISPEHYWSRILPLARAHRLTVYDTLHLELAERRALPLASLDGALNAAAKKVGVAVLGER